MTRLRIKKLRVAGFRSFGQAHQVAEPADTISVFWGGNSQGKTSLAEALEFLLTGQIARRELLAGAKDEFADSLRNAHIGEHGLVVVEAEMLATDGKTYSVKRTLTEDYKRGGAAGCISNLEIDGAAANEDELSSRLGIVFFPAPLRAPVLSQHSLGFLFSSSPGERAAYFRAVLDTQELEDFRQGVAALPNQLQAPTSQELDDLDAVEASGSFDALFSKLLKAKSRVGIGKVVTEAISALLTSLGLTPSSDLVEMIQQLRTALEQRRSVVFPMQLFARKPFSPWQGAAKTLPQLITSFVTERAKSDSEAHKLMSLFEAALALPHVHDAHNPIDCPLCASKSTLTPERVAWITEQVRANSAYQTAHDELSAAMSSTKAQVATTDQLANLAVPGLVTRSPAERHRVGFSVKALSALVRDDALVRDWFADVRSLWRAWKSVVAAAETLVSEVQLFQTDALGWVRQAEFVAATVALETRQKDFVKALASFEGPDRRIELALKREIDAASAVAGWDALCRLTEDIEGLEHALIQRNRFAAECKAVDKAIADIEKGIGVVIDQKFIALSGEVRRWWDLLRPEEATYFDTVQRRSAKAKRMIDLRAGLSLKDDKSDPKFRDAVAVFSQSQLHCLGLAMFLARATTEGAGFIVLDDPVLTSDDDYRPNFASSVIEALLADGIQVLVLTQDYGTAKDIGTRWAHAGSAHFDLVRNDPLTGSEIRNKDDDLAGGQLHGPILPPLRSARLWHQPG
ncbi:MAG: hypothetical protein EON93_03695 [Burkholderiales bacterium]|nr:MAG: hypothetical protein EON93_03695 [Burkholderiales bacterium]